MQIHLPRGTVPRMSTDGRAVRALRTRDAVLDALEAFVREGRSDPGARHVAERAGVSTRSVFAHFAGMDDLHAALADRIRARVIGLLRPIDPAGPLEARVADLCEQRGRVAEEIGPFRRAAAARAESSPALAAARREGERASIDQIERVFATELAPLPEAERAARVATVDAIVSGDAWDRLRTAHSLSTRAAMAATTAAVSALLGAGVGTSDRPGAPEVDRRAEAEIVLADVDLRSARLVAAVEAGTPPDVVAPRLAELAAVRAAIRSEGRVVGGTG